MGISLIGIYDPTSISAPGDFSFNRGYIELTIYSSGCQYDRLASLWLDDIEIFRTSTAQPSAGGVKWTQRKDITPLVSVFSEPHKLIFDLGNRVDSDTCHAAFDVSMKLTVFHKSSYGPNMISADAVIPISAKRSAKGMAGAFMYPDQAAEVLVKMPYQNVRSAMLTVAATGQADEEMWWANVPQSVVGQVERGAKNNSLPLQGYGSFREVVVSLDGQVMGLVWPFPTVSPGSLAPTLHRPVVGPQTFDMREQEIDITAWLPILCDGEYHLITMHVLGVDDTGINGAQWHMPNAYWVLSGKIFLWLEEDSNSVTNGTKAASSRSIMDYVAKSTGSSSGLTYNQSITSFLQVSSTVWTPGGPRHVTWNQDFSMQASGSVGVSGFSQSLHNSYIGSGRARHNNRVFFTSGFKYPITANYSYQRGSEIDGANYDLAVSAEIDQGFWISLIGQTPWVTGLVPFMCMHRIEVPTGTILNIWRRGKGFFYQADGGKDTGGWAEARHHLSLGSADEWNEDVPFPLMTLKNLYSRDVEVANGTLTMDEEWVIRDDMPIDSPTHPQGIFDTLPQKRDLEGSDGGQAAPLSPGTFAPLEMTRLGGTNPFNNLEDMRYSRAYLTFGPDITITDKGAQLGIRAKGDKKVKSVDDDDNRRFPVYAGTGPGLQLPKEMIDNNVFADEAGRLYNLTSGEVYFPETGQVYNISDLEGDGVDVRPPARNWTMPTLDEAKT